MREEMANHEEMEMEIASHDKEIPTHEEMEMEMEIASHEGEDG